MLLPKINEASDDVIFTLLLTGFPSIRSKGRQLHAQSGGTGGAGGRNSGSPDRMRELGKKREVDQEIVSRAWLVQSFSHSTRKDSSSSCGPGDGDEVGRTQRMRGSLVFPPNTRQKLVQVCECEVEERVTERRIIENREEEKVVSRR